jgi:site-specific recombinase XerD
MLQDVNLFRRKNGYWYARFSRDQIRSLGTRNKAEALPIYNRLRRDWLAGKISQITGEGPAKTLGGYLTEIEELGPTSVTLGTHRNNLAALKTLAHYAGQTIRLDRITPKHMDEAIAEMKRRGLSSATINICIRHARSALRKAVEWGYVKTNPLSRVRELPKYRKAPAFLDQAGVTRLLTGIQDVDKRRLITAYLATGRRASELIQLTWEDVNLERGEYLIRKSKSHLSRWYPMNQMFRAVLDSIGPSQGRIWQRWTDRHHVSRFVKQELRKAGYGDLRLHDLRHTYASLQAMAGRDMKTIQELLGHTQLSTTLIYAHLTQAYLREAAEVFLGPVDLGGGKDGAN